MRSTVFGAHMQECPTHHAVFGLTPIRLSKDFVIEHPVALAPMTAVTDAPMREVVRGLGGGYLTSEMIVSRDSISFAKNSQLKVLGFSHAIQLAGNDPILMAEAARMSVDLGAKVIDINFGCPAKKIAVGSYCGAHLMRDETLARSIVSSVVRSVRVPVTVKMRLGWDENSLNAASIARMVQDEGGSMVTIHARTRAQFYGGCADWLGVKKIKECLQIPLLINGDITTYSDAACALRQSGADGIMIGRAAYGRPWILRDMINFFSCGVEAPEPEPAEKLNIIWSHLDGIFSTYGSRGVGLAKKHMSWYSRGFTNSSFFRAALTAAEKESDIVELVKNFFVVEELSG